MNPPVTSLHGFLLSALLSVLAVPSAHAQIDSALLGGMKARSIGPAGMSGRIAGIDAVVSDPRIIYVGAATGGVWKSTNGGITWTPIFDEQHTSSIGALAVFQPNPDIVWVGTGEGNLRNSAGVGYGVYRTLDAGRTWSHLGLEKSEHIHRIVLHPADPNIAYVAILGPAWSDGTQRGVFKTTDGGKTWSRVLYGNEKTGAADLVMDPRNPNKLLAAMWEHRRWPWFFQSGGPGSGLYVTHDGGATWTRLTEKDGLPKGELGRIGVAIAQSDPSVVYALVEATNNALIRSDDGGKRWRIVNDSPNIAPRPFYYADIRVDPKNENRVYSLHSRLTVSEDGGKMWKRIARGIHGDHHFLWIQPEDGRFLIDGNDGGVAISYDRGETWRFVENLPLAQYYHINIDMETPYNVYGGMQDNGSWRGPSAVWENGGIRSHHWTEVGYGDGFATLADPGDPRYGYSMSQGGFLRRFDTKTGERKDIRPPAPDGVELRFNWNAAIAIDPSDPKTVYYGSQFVHRSRDRGETWEIVSPDLTTNDPAKQRQKESGGLTRDVTNAENHTTILTIAPSPRERGIIWVGTDDGNVQLTRDGGKTWTNLANRMKGVPPATWVPHIEPSKFDAASAFVVFDDHRRGNWTPYVFQTTDYGRIWTSLATPNLWGFVHVIEQDPVQPNLLYLGTEFGLWVSLDGGKSWMKWTHGVPTVPVTGLLVHPRDHDLVIGTHGRSAYILDDVRPLRSFAADPGPPGLLQRPLHLFEIPPAQQVRVKQVDGMRNPGDGIFRGENRPYGALLTYVVNLGSDTVAIEVLDSDGAVIRKMEGAAKKGVNRTAWDLRRERFKEPPQRDVPDEPERGPEVLPGTYTVRMRAGGHEATQKVEVLADTRYDIALADRREKDAAVLRAGRAQELVSEAVKRIRTATAAIETVVERARDDGASGDLESAGSALKEKLATMYERLADPPWRRGIYHRMGTAFGKIRYVYGSLTSSWDAPTPAQLTYLRQAEEEVRAVLMEFNRLFAQDVAVFRRQAEAAGFTLFPPEGPIQLEPVGAGR